MLIRFALCAVLLNLVALQAHADQLQDWRRYPYQTAPRLTTPPTIDGNVDRAEWQHAGQFGPLLVLPEGVSDDRQRDLYVAYDDQNLYLAWRIERPRGAVQPLSPEQTGRIDSWRNGDLVEIMIDVGHTESRYFNFAGYASGAFADGLCGPSVDRHWNADWRRAASLTDDGWQGEVAIPFAALGLDGAPTEGTIWGFDFVDNQRTPMEQAVLYGFRGGAWHRLKNLGHIRFSGPADAAPVVRYRKLADAGDGNLQLELELVNPSDRDAAVVADVQILRRKTGDDAKPKSFYDHIESGADDAYDEGAAEFEKSTTLEGLLAEAMAAYEPIDGAAINEKVVTAAGQRRTVGLLRPVGPGEYLALVNVRSESGAPLCSVARVVRLDPPLALTLEPYWLRRQEMDVVVDLRKLDVPDGATVTLSILPAEGDEPLTQAPASASGDAHGRAFGTLSTAKLEPGFYRVRAVLADAQGKTLAQNEAAVEKPATPVWFDNNLGKSLPRPWTPVSADGTGRVEVWGRVYDLSQALPVQVTSQGMDVLAAPVRFVATSQGKTLDWKVTALSLESADEQNAVYNVTLDAGAATINGTVSIEFDGLVWYDLKLTPAGDALALDQFELTAAMNGRFAELASTHTFLHDPFISNKPLTPAQFDPAQVGRMQPMQVPFTPYLWIGNEEAGLGFVAEAPVDWKTRQPDRVLQVVPPASDGEPATLRVRMVDHPVTLEAPMRLQFGLQVTPIRAMPDRDKAHLVQAGGPVVDESYYAQIAATGGKSVVYHGGWKGDKATEWSGWPSHPRDPERREQIKTGIAFAHKHGLKVALYTGWGIATDSDEWKHFRHEMARKPLENAGMNTYRQTAALDGVYIDYMTWMHSQLMEAYDNDGVFWDSAANLPASAEIALGTGWVDDQGRVRPAYPVRGTRELFKRIYTLTHGELKDDGLIVNFGGSIWAINVFCDIFHRGEGRPMHVPTLKEAWQPLEDFRAHYNARPFGTLYVAMNKNFRRLPMTVNLHHAVTLLHGTHCKSAAVFLKYPNQVGYGATDQPMSRIWAARTWLPFDHDTVWHTYHDDAARFVRLSPGHLLSSVFVSKDGKRALLVVSNLEAAAAPGATVELDLEGLGFASPGATQAEDAILLQPLEITNGALTLDIEPQRYRLIKLWQP